MKMILLLLLIAQFAIPQDDSLIKLFPGKWKMDTDKAEIYEEWEVSNDTELIGKSYSVENREDVISEILYLEKFGEQWAYVALPEGQSITLFALVEFSLNKFIFENLEHDFPQRIIYEFHKEGELNVAIEGLLNGEMKRKEFSFTIVND